MILALWDKLIDRYLLSIKYLLITKKGSRGTSGEGGMADKSTNSKFCIMETEGMVIFSSWDGELFLKLTIN